MNAAYFITGTDTGVGKTLVSCALLHVFAARGKTVVGMKPVAAGCASTARGLVCEDVANLMAASNVSAPLEMVNPYAFQPPIAPHIAATQAGVAIEIAPICAACAALQALAEVVIVEGIGGWRVPLNAREDSADMARQLGLPVILVVGMRLGCLNHALLTAQAIKASGLELAGWVANRIDPSMPAFDENLRALQARLAAPLLGVAPYAAQPSATLAAEYIRLDG
ncbi:MAG: dethiobiotin synthase [Sulfuricellaceae bacterium]